MRYILILLFGLMITNGLYAAPICRQGIVQIVTRFNRGKPVYYHNYSREEFARKTNSNLDLSTTGLTHARLQYAVGMETQSSMTSQGGCVSLKKVILEFGFNEIDVYIDKKYKKNSCPYNVTKKHEDYHVGVAREAVKFFDSDIKNQLRKVVKKVKAQPVKNQDQLQQWLKVQHNEIIKGMDPLIQHIQSKIDEKNAAIDTPESYRKTTALCPQKDWE